MTVSPRPLNTAGTWSPTLSRSWATTTVDGLTFRNNLALAYLDAGRLEKAIPLLERGLADSERVLGEDDPDTLTSRNNLASAYWATGGGDPAPGAGLADSERVLGEDHRITLTSRNNLANAYRDTGQLEEAIRYTSGPLPTLSGSWASTTPIPWAPATT